MKQASRHRVSVALATTAAAAALAAPSVAPAATKTFANTSAVTIPTLGNATPYPSTITTSGFVGPVKDVNVTLNNLQHPSAWDLSVLLVGPTGQRTILMSSTGSATGQPAPNETFTFDDEAATSLTMAPCNSDAVAPGSYKPTRATCGDANAEAFGPPAPAGPYPVSLSVFDGKAANGTWKLFIRDEDTSDGVLAGAGASASPGPPIGPRRRSPSDRRTRQRSRPRPSSSNRARLARRSNAGLTAI